MSFNPSKESTAVLTPTETAPPVAEPSFNPSKESTAVLTQEVDVMVGFEDEFQPLKGINGRTDRPGRCSILR